MASPKSKTGENSVLNSAQVDWNDLLNQFESTGGQVLFMKGKIRVRFFPFDDPKKIFFPVESIFRGKVRTKYVAKVWYLDAGKGESEPNPNESRVRALLLSKRDCRSVIQFQLEGWDLFNSTEGHAISFIKSGTGTNSSVNLSPSPKPLPIPEDVMTEGEEFDMEEVVSSWNAYQRQKAEEATSSGDAKATGSKDGSKEENDEEEDY